MFADGNRLLALATWDKVAPHCSRLPVCVIPLSTERANALTALRIGDGSTVTSIRKAPSARLP